MADIIHERVIEEPRESSGMGFLWGAILLLIVIVLFVFALPYLRNISTNPQINIPSRIDVNVNRQPQQAPTK